MGSKIVNLIGIEDVILEKVTVLKLIDYACTFFVALCLYVFIATNSYPKASLRAALTVLVSITHQLGGMHYSW